MTEGNIIPVDYDERGNGKTISIKEHADGKANATRRPTLVFELR